MINKISHWFSHLFGRNTVNVVTWQENEFICVGLKCADCGKIDERSIKMVETFKVVPMLTNIDPVQE